MGAFHRRRLPKRPVCLLIRRTVCSLAIVGFLFTGPDARAGLVAVDLVDNDSRGFLTMPTTEGWSFKPNVNVTVTHLGFLDYEGDGLNFSHAVGLWLNGGALLGSTTVQTSDPLLDGFRYTSLTPINLLAGQTYVIGAFYSPNSDFLRVVPFGASSFSTAPEISYLGARYVVGPNSLQRPDVVSTTTGFWGPNFQFTPTVVPEPGTALFGFALVGAIVGFRRR
ncbi:MAG TPA: DUF4082 domain-containing protein [Chthoniobacteraceae bacterium]|jgi:hypothetical protein|nr:DUF4082 domain-containing protein [Chthoniobacteraceae bacterium]